MRLADMLRAKFKAEDHVLPDAQGYDRRICQCCGNYRKDDTEPECVCDGLNWHMSADGRIECEAHRFARAVGMSKKVFGFK